MLLLASNPAMLPNNDQQRKTCKLCPLTTLTSSPIAHSPCSSHSDSFCSEIKSGKFHMLFPLTEMLFPQIHSLNGPLPPSGLYSNVFFSERSSPTTLCNLPLTPLLTHSQNSLSSFHYWAHYTFYLYCALYISPSYYIQNISSSG